MISDWKYYNHIILPKAGPKEKVDITREEQKDLFKKYNQAIMIRYTSEFDTYNGQQWYFCIKDDSFSISNLKSKRRNVINKGIKNFDVSEIIPNEHIEELYEIINDSNKGYAIAKAAERIESIALKCDTLSRDRNSKILGAFSKDTGRVVGYLWLEFNGKCINMIEQHCIREYECLGCNAALDNKMCELYTDVYLQDGYYLCDGERNILHQTAFQEYLIKYFGFRKAYCRINLIYRKPFNILIRITGIIYKPIIPLIKKFFPGIYPKVEAVMMMEEIRKVQKNV